MSLADTLSAAGLIANMLGVGILFKYGFPQPSHDQGVGLALEDGTTLPDGRTVAQHNQDSLNTAKRYRRLAFTALFLILVGFVLQFLALFA